MLIMEILLPNIVIKMNKTIELSISQELLIQIDEFRLQYMVSRDVAIDSLIKSGLRLSRTTGGMEI